MAKIAFSKLKCKINDTEVPVQIGEETIMVKQYLPIQEKLGLIGRVVELAHEQDHNFSNPVKASVYRDLEIIFAYSNLSFTEKQKEDLPKLYDMMASAGVIDQILLAIPTAEITHIYNGIKDTIDAYYAYQNSVLGLLDTITADYSQLDLDATKIQSKLADPKNAELIKGLLTNLS